MKSYDKIEAEIRKRELRRSPWARLYRAVYRGTGVRLSQADVQKLAADGALMIRGERDAHGIDHND